MVAGNNRGFLSGIIFQIFMVVSLIGIGAGVVRYFTNKTLVNELGRCHDRYEKRVRKLERKEKGLIRKISRLKKSSRKKEMVIENESLKKMTPSMRCCPKRRTCTMVAAMGGQRGSNK